MLYLILKLLLSEENLYLWYGHVFWRHAMLFDLTTLILPEDISMDCYFFLLDNNFVDMDILLLYIIIHIIVTIIIKKRKHRKLFK